jgi:hypothetical protein
MIIVILIFKTIELKLVKVNNHIDLIDLIIAELFNINNKIARIQEYH